MLLGYGSATDKHRFEKKEQRPHPDQRKGLPMVVPWRCTRVRLRYRGKKRRARLREGSPKKGELNVCETKLPRELNKLEGLAEIKIRAEIKVKKKGTTH